MVSLCLLSVGAVRARLLNNARGAGAGAHGAGAVRTRAGVRASVQG